MARVEVDIEEVDLDGDRGPVAGVRATCSKCRHQTESFGTGERSRKRCLVLLREECEQDEENFYADADEGGDRPAPRAKPVRCATKPVQLAQVDRPAPASPSIRPSRGAYWPSQAAGRDAAGNEVVGFGGAICTREGAEVVEVCQVYSEDDAKWLCGILNSCIDMLAALDVFLEPYRHAAKHELPGWARETMAAFDRAGELLLERRGTPISG